MHWIFYAAKDETEAEDVTELLEEIAHGNVDVKALISAITEDENKDWDNDQLRQRYESYQKYKDKPGFIVDDDDFSQLEAKHRK
jgi:hypothetical protein